MGNVTKFLFISCAMAALLDLTQGGLRHLPDLNEEPPPSPAQNPFTNLNQVQTPPKSNDGLDYCKVILMPEEQSQASSPLEAASSSPSSTGTSLSHQTYLKALQKMTSLNFPLSREASKSQKLPFSNEYIKRIIQNSINQSQYAHFNIDSSQSPSGTYQTFETCFNVYQKRLPQSHQYAQMLVFLVNLCLKNIAFLLCIQPLKDNSIEGLRLIEQEVMLTLNWLHHFLNSDGSLEARVLQYHLAKHFESEQNAATRQCSDTFDDRIVDQNLKIHEAGLVNHLLKKYYTSMNPDKWKTVFGDNDLLNFYVRFAHYCHNRIGPSSWQKHWNRVQIANSLPWQGGKMTLLTIGIREADSASLFNYNKSIEETMNREETAKKAKKKHK